MMVGWKILITDGLEESGMSYLEKYSIVHNRSGISPDELLGIVQDYDALIVRSRTIVNGSVLQFGKKLKVVGRSGVGVDNINLEKAKELGITVVNSPVGPTIAVAELTIGLILSLLRDIPYANASLKAGIWAKKELMGSELYGKTLGIIGFGRIGIAVAERAKAFGMNIIFNDQKLLDEETREPGLRSVACDEVFSQSDIITLHVPLTEHTKGLINDESLRLMKDGVRIVCTARGGVVDEDAILAALNQGKVAGLALDVFNKEPPEVSELILHPRVIVTPHIGVQTHEAQSRTGYDIACEVISALGNNALRFRIV
jgi:D-3-phosphoglycerate dehydrogenase / 2-oxoglutarate reductase